MSKKLYAPEAVPLFLVMVGLAFNRPTVTIVSIINIDINENIVYYIYKLGIAHFL